jgi:2-C-methyl-D-erythritol 4-phosphate cytidylyltransferase/2-C-methyl-D-erythritol 2,4-cyclodiphosphate synthase
MAAGTGSRFGADRPKQFSPLAGKTVLRHAAEALLRDEIGRASCRERVFFDV